MNQNITIADLTPAVRGDFTLRFEAISVDPSPNNPDQISLQIADESGCINAYFINHGKHIKPGNVYELQHFKCKVVNHSLRVELTKESKIARVKFLMSFKDLVNNLSQKFYASKAQHESFAVQKDPLNQKESQVAKEQKSQSIENGLQHLQNGKKKADRDIITQETHSGKGEIKGEKETTENQKSYRKENGKNESKERSKDKKKTYVEKKAEANNLPDRQDKRNEKEIYDRVPKKKFIEKKQETSEKPQPQHQKQSQLKLKNERVMLKDIYKYQERNVNLFVQVETKTTINCGKYILVRACDSSGASYLELDKRCHLENKAWYCLKKFKVFGDKEYGFVVSQQEYSTYDILEEFDEVPDHKVIYFPKPK